MSKSNSLETSILDHILNNANIANVGDATGLRGSTSAGSLYISLHTADPGEAGSQTTSEATFGGYARLAVSRSGGQWTVSGGSAQNAATLTFATCSSGSNTITHVGIGTALSGAGVLLYSGALTSSLAVSTGIAPQFGAGTITLTED